MHFHVMFDTCGGSVILGNVGDWRYYAFCSISVRIEESQSLDSALKLRKNGRMIVCRGSVDILE